MSNKLISVSILIIILSYNFLELTPTQNIMKIPLIITIGFSMLFFTILSLHYIKHRLKPKDSKFVEKASQKLSNAAKFLLPIVLLFSFDLIITKHFGGQKKEEILATRTHCTTTASKPRLTVEREEINGQECFSIINPHELFDLKIDTDMITEEIKIQENARISVIFFKSWIFGNNTYFQVTGIRTDNTP